MESATQLLNAVEWADATGHSFGVRVLVLAPTDQHSLRQIDATAALARADGIDVVVRHVRAVRPGLPLLGAQTVGDIARATRLVIGDPFSRFIQTALPVSRAKDVVIIDDGTATWDYVACVNGGNPLNRWTDQAPSRRATSIRATRLLSPGNGRAVEVFTCLRNAVPIGATGLANGYRWLRSQWQPKLVANQVDLLGTSLVDTGVIERRAYLDAVAMLANAGRPVRYIAHRRESESQVAEIARLPDVRVIRPSMPVELLLRKGPVAARVITFPSTATHTLPIVLADVSVVFDVQPIEETWFAPGASERMRNFVARIAAEARQPVPRCVVAPPRQDDCVAPSSDG